MFERMIAEHCAPALAGIKPSNIVAFRKDKMLDIHKKINQLNFDLNPRDIYAEILCECEKRVLIIVYRKNILKKHLNDYLNNAFLKQYGYKNATALPEYFDILKTRLDCDNFPHEIGVFLGYPLHDIYCFIHHRDDGCIMVGDWRVYHNAEQANKLFLRYKSCKRAVCKKIDAGSSLARIFCA